MKRPLTFYSEGFKLDGDVYLRATIAWYREHLPAKA
jgi:hypothetical protein